mmetsp:Transcript_4868/g.12209  ORF Transcript_4868/g.12209 Transcript_4868/m.12209 type:complete len:240 (-) Transcript_4868:43-762(-)
MLLDAMLLHVLLAICGRRRRQRPEALGQKVDDRKEEVWEEVLQLRRPLHADEARAHHEDAGFFFVQALEVRVLLEDVTAPAFEETLVQVWPTAFGTSLLVDSGEPQRLAPLVERPEVAATSDDAVIEVQRLLLLREDGLDRRQAFGSVKLRDLAPNELATHPLLDDGEERECQSVQVLGLHIGAQHAGGIFEVLFAVDDGHKVVVLEVPRAAQPRETAADDEDAPLGRHDLLRSGRRWS